MNIDNITIINNIINRKIVDILASPLFFFMLLAVKSFELFLKHKGCDFISESFALNLHIFCGINK